MKRKIQLLYFDGCPNAERARQNLKAALLRAGFAPVWEEINLHSASAPEQWRGFPSPTVMIDGKEILTGISEAVGAGACRFGGAPSIEQIVAAISAAEERS